MEIRKIFDMYQNEELIEIEVSLWNVGSEIAILTDNRNEDIFYLLALQQKRAHEWFASSKA